MRCDWRNDLNAPRPCHVVNLETGEILSPCAMADEETGEYERYDCSVTDRGTLKFNCDPITHLIKTISGIARVEIRSGPPPK